MNKWVEADNKLKEVMPKASKVEPGRETKIWNVNEEELEELERVQKEKEEAWGKMNEILHRI